MSRLRPRSPALLALAFILLLGLTYQSAAAAPSTTGKIDPSLQQQMTLDPAKKLPVIVEMYPPVSSFAGNGNALRANQALDLFGKLGKDGFAVGGLPLVNSAAGFANAKGIDTLARHGGVAYVHEDSLIEPRRGDVEPNVTRPPGQLSAPYPRVVRADKVWLAGPTGKGVGVAVLDSGVYAHPDLVTPTNRLVASVNFVDELAPGANADPGGHGTHVAGIIAGNGTGTDLSRRQSQPLLSGDAALVEYVGVAPGANILDVRVLDSKGYGRVSSVVRGIEWVLRHTKEYNIRVMNLSFGAPAATSYTVDILSAAVEIAWKRGIVVVAAAGNRGQQWGTVERPGLDPFLITVGYLDDQGTLPTADDTLGDYSAWGVRYDPTVAKPDVVAPGRRIVSLRVAGSYLDTLYPDRIVTAKKGASYFRLTGTSMATAVVSGTVALMLERSPLLTPDQVKAILKGTTQTFGQDAGSATPLPGSAGAGLVDAEAAVNSGVLAPANLGLRPAYTTARALYSALYGKVWPIPWKDPYYQGIDWNSLTWDNIVWDEVAWENVAWDNIAWDTLNWVNIAWDTLGWNNIAWDNIAWDSLSSPPGAWAQLPPD